MRDSAFFSAPWSTSVKIISVAVMAILLVASLAVAPALPPKVPAFSRWLLGMMPLLIILSTLPFVVRGYALGARELEIRRFGWSNRIPFADIVSAEANPDAMNGSLRLCGSGGLFGFFGWFWNRQLGMYRAYCTDLKRCVIVRLRTRTIVVSPDEPERFVVELTARLGEARRA